MTDKRAHNDRTETVSTEHGPNSADTDVVSDPALDDHIGGDWSGEGGATPVGPATQTEKDEDEAAAASD